MAESGDGVEVGKAILSILPVMGSIGKSVDAELKSSTSAIAKAGKTIGLGLGKSIGEGAASGAQSLEELEREIQAATNKTAKVVETARLKQEDATRKAQIAQQAYNEAVEKSGTDSSRSLSAQDRLIKAQRSAASAQTEYTKATKVAAAEQSDMDKRLAEAKAQVESSGSVWQSLGAKIKAGLKGGAEQLSSFNTAAGEQGSEAGSKFAEGFREHATEGANKLKEGLVDNIKGLIGPMIAVAGVAEVSEFAKSSFEAGESVEKASKQTDAVLKSTGDSAKVSAGQITDWATSISNATTVSADSVQKTENTLLTFPHIAGNTLKTATTTIEDMAAATGKSSTAITTAVGKALNDPKSGLGSLSRYGTTFSDAQKKQILGLQASGKTAQAQQLILDQLNQRYAGSANSQATAASRAQNAWHNLQIELGEKLLPIADDLFDGLNKYIIPALGSLVDILGGGDKEAGGALVKFEAYLSPVATVLEDTGKRLLPIIVAAWHQFASAMAADLPGIKKLGGSIAPMFSAIEAVVVPLAKVVFPLLASVLAAVFSAAIGIIRGAVKVITGIFQVLHGLFTGNMTEIKKGFLSIFSGLWTAVEGVLKGALKIILAALKAWGITSEVKKIANAIATEWGKVEGFFVNPFKAGVSTIESGVKSFDSYMVTKVAGIVSAIRTDWAKVEPWLVNPFGSATKAITNKLKSWGIAALIKQAAGAIGSAWQVIESGFEKPVNWVIDNVINKLIDAIDWVASKLGLNINIKHVSDIAGGSTGENVVHSGRASSFENGGRVKAKNAFEAGGIDRIRANINDGEHITKTASVRSLDKALPGGLDYINRTGMWPVGPAAEVGGINQNAKPGPSVPVKLAAALPTNLAAVIRRGPKPGEKGGYGGVNPLAYAASQLGKTGWYDRCLAFVNAAWNYSVGRFQYATARQSMNAGPRSMAGIPPAGAAVYWSTGPDGHIALAAGDGTVYSNDIITPGVISRVPQTMVNKWGPYEGWWSPTGAKGAAGSLPGGSGPLGTVAKWAKSKIANAIMGKVPLGKIPAAGMLEQLLKGAGSKLISDAAGVLFGKQGVTGAYANGGPTRKGIGIVGENGPELVEFNGTENVVPAHKMGARLAAAAVGDYGSSSYRAASASASGGCDHDVYVQDPFTGEYLLARVATVADGRIKADKKKTARSR